MGVTHQLPSEGAETGESGHGASQRPEIFVIQRRLAWR